MTASPISDLNPLFLSARCQFTVANKGISSPQPGHQPALSPLSRFSCSLCSIIVDNSNYMKFF